MHSAQDIIEELLLINKNLRKENKFLKEELRKQAAKIEKLEQRLNKNSKNSDLPPSLDKLKKKPAHKNSRRKDTGKKVGGQKGHKGKTLNKVLNPDKIIKINPTHCKGCGKAVIKKGIYKKESRQVFDIPPPKLEVTEYQCYESKCSCGVKTKAEFPSSVRNHTQYGIKIKSFATLLNNEYLLPFNKISELIHDFCGVKINEGTLFNMNKEIHLSLKKFNTDLKEKLEKEPVVHFDETGCNCKGARWIHAAVTENLSYFFAHKSRGFNAMSSELSVLPNFKGTGIHDCFSSYFMFKKMGHGLCNAHILRDFQKIMELKIPKKKKDWVVKMLTLLINAHKYKLENHYFPPDEKNRISIEFDECIKSGYKHHPPPIRKKGKRGRLKRTESRNLLERLELRKEEFLAFVNFENIPFDNNLAERAIRMVKLKNKISGCFRTVNGVAMFTRAKSFLATCRKKKIKLLDALELALSYQDLSFILAK